MYRDAVGLRRVDEGEVSDLYEYVVSIWLIIKFVQGDGLTNSPFRRRIFKGE